MEIIKGFDWVDCGEEFNIENKCEKIRISEASECVSRPADTLSMDTVEAYGELCSS